MSTTAVLAFAAMLAVAMSVAHGDEAGPVANAGALRASKSTGGTAKPKPGPDAKRPPGRDRVVHTETPRHKMPLSYYVPAASVGKDRVPLVLSYHGLGGSNESEIGPWINLAEKHGFVVACPKSYFAGGKRPPTDKRPLGPIRELEDAIAIVEMIDAKRRIDGRFVMVTGFSGGGNPAYTAGLLRPDVFPFVCSRCGNFPDSLVVEARKHPDYGRSVQTALTKSHIYFFYGEKDHPIILETDAPMQIEFFETAKAANFQKEMIAGMAHVSRPDRAADWFVGKIAGILAEPAAKGPAVR
ncbi:MAG: hypothetical protein ACK6CT_02145 [Planctomycetia bacterium]|jgi:poly(3-hydroxybutyrate) depolymerase